MATTATDSTNRRRASFLLPESLLQRLDRRATDTGLSRSHVVETLLARELSQTEQDLDTLIYEARQREPDLSLEECPELLARIEKLLTT